MELDCRHAVLLADCKAVCRIGRALAMTVAIADLLAEDRVPDPTGGHGRNDQIQPANHSGQSEQKALCRRFRHEEMETQAGSPARVPKRLYGAVFTMIVPVIEG